MATTEQYVGSPVLRKEDAEFLTGQARHTDDLAVPGMLWMSVARTPTNELGVKGVGETGTIASPPAVIAAVVDALSHLGVRDDERPATPGRVWRAIQAAKGGAA